MLFRLLAFTKRPAVALLFRNSPQSVFTLNKVTKSLLLRNSTCQIIQNSSFHSKSINYFASSQDWGNSRPPVHPLIEKIQQHPHIMEQLIDFTNLLQTKGVDVTGKKPSFMQIMKVMNDPEIKAKVQVLAKDMQAAGIQLDMNAIQELQSSFGDLANINSTSSTTLVEEAEVDEKNPVQEEQHGRKRGVVNRVKELFKK